MDVLSLNLVVISRRWKWVFLFAVEPTFIVELTSFTREWWPLQFCWLPGDWAAQWDQSWGWDTWAWNEDSGVPCIVSAVNHSGSSSRLSHDWCVWRSYPIVWCFSSISQFLLGCSYALVSLFGLTYGQIVICIKIITDRVVIRIILVLEYN